MNPHRTVSALVFVAFASIGYSSPANAEWVYCSGENQTCKPPVVGEQMIRFGAQDKWVTASWTDGVVCSIQMFGVDPWPNATKHCEYDDGN
jgi:hypothetical protein